MGLLLLPALLLSEAAVKSLADEIQEFLHAHWEALRAGSLSGDFTDACLHAGLRASGLLEAAGAPATIPHPTRPDGVASVVHRRQVQAFYRTQWTGEPRCVRAWWRTLPEGDRYTGSLQRLNQLVRLYRATPGLPSDEVTVVAGGDEWEYRAGETILLQFGMAVGNVVQLLREQLGRLSQGDHIDVVPRVGERRLALLENLGDTGLDNFE